jgi:hypothetical protein
MKFTNNAIILLAGALLAVVGSFLDFADVSAAGAVWDGDTGKAVVVIMIIGVVLHLMKSHVWAAVALCASGGILLSQAVELFRADGIGLGMGGYLVAIGSLAAIWGASQHISKKM